MKINILGAGITGVLSALALSSLGAEVTLIERKAKGELDNSKDIRNLALTKSSFNFITSLSASLSDKMHEYAAEVQDIYILDNKHSDVVHLPFLQNSVDVGGYFIMAHHLKDILSEELSIRRNISFLDSTIYQNVISHDSFAELELSDGKRLSSDLLVVCEGYHSGLRKNLFREQYNINYGQTALVFNVATEVKHDNTAVEHFLPEGPFAILPSIHPYQCGIVWSLSKETAKSCINMSKEELEFFVQENFGPFLGKVNIISNVISHDLKAYMADSFVHKRVVLVGDSAHVIHPLAGQGLNQGIGDIKALYNLLLKYLYSSSTIEGDQTGDIGYVLNVYNDERMQDNINMLMLTHGLDKLFSNNIKPLKSFRRLGLKIVDNANFLKSRIIRYASGNR